MVKGSVSVSGASVLADAYYRAIYRIEAAEPVDLCLDALNPELGRLVASGESVAGVFVTACNPRSRCLRPSANLRRMRALQRAVVQLGRSYSPGRALDPLGVWPEEASLWIPGLSLSSGRVLAARFGQNAFIACDGLGVARLVWVSRFGVRVAEAGGG